MFDQGNTNYLIIDGLNQIWCFIRGGTLSYMQTIIGKNFNEKNIDWYVWRTIIPTDLN
jgi:hypothetical protein